MAGQVYETEALFDQYMLLHYGEPSDQLPWVFGPREALNFPARCVQEGLDLEAIPSGARALDLGCAVGRSAFELARYCQEVVAIDYSARFIDAAQHLARGDAVPYRIVEVGQIMRPSEARVPGVARSRVHFEVGDAQELRPDLGSYEVVLACNLLCRLADPLRLLQRLPGLVVPGGQLLITTPLSWLESFTPVEKWLGGARTDAPDTLEALKHTLSPDFVLEGVKDMPFLIREHRRKYQWSVAQASRWTRR